MAKISILLPVFNGARHLAAAIESVLAQTIDDWQLIICDDRSTDESWAIASRYAQKDSRISLQKNPHNLGLFENYNRCLRISGAASGQCQYVKPFAQDDVLDPHALEKLSAVLDEQRDVALVSCARNWIADDGTATGLVRPFHENRKIRADDVIIYNLIQLTNWVGEPSTVLFRSELAGDGFDVELFHYGDIDYWFRIIRNSNYFYLDESLCSFRRHEHSTTSKNLGGLYFAIDVFRLGKKYRSYLENLGESEAHFFKRAVETAALNVDHLVRGEGLTVDKMLEAKRSRATAGSTPESPIIDCSPNSVSAVPPLDREDAFRELSFHSLRYVTELLYEYSALYHKTEAEKEHLQQQLSNMRESTSWKITAPLRNILRNAQNGPEA